MPKSEPGKMLYVVRRKSDGKFWRRKPGHAMAGWVKDPRSKGCVMGKEDAELQASGRDEFEVVWLGDAVPPGAKGLKLDDGKLRYELLDDAAEDELVAVLSFGAVKYEPDNWRVVEDAEERYVGALRRHISKRRRGRIFDSETGLLEYAHAACCAHFLLGLELMRRPDLVDSLPERLRHALAVARELRAKRLAGAKVRQD